MATNITSKDYSLYKSWGLSFARNGAFPLDDTSIFLSLADAQAYASNAKGASYTGQIIAVVEEKEGVTSATAYLIKDANGTLEALGAASGIEGLNTLLQTKRYSDKQVR